MTFSTGTKSKIEVADLMSFPILFIGNLSRHLFFDSSDTLTKFEYIDKFFKFTKFEYNNVSFSSNYHN